MDRRSKKSCKMACKGNKGEMNIGCSIRSTSGPAPAPGCRGGQRETSSRFLSSVRAPRKRPRTRTERDSQHETTTRTPCCGVERRDRHAESQWFSNLAVQGNHTLKRTAAWPWPVRFRLNWTCCWYFLKAPR